MKKRTPWLLLLVLLTLFAACPATAADYSPPREIRVGFFHFDGYHMRDTEGRPAGYGYEALQRMAVHANWTYAYAGYDKSWSEMLRMLENGDIDLLTSAQKTPEREARFAFSKRAIGQSSTIVTCRAGDRRYATDAYRRWNGIRVGMLKGNSRNASFTAFATRNGFTYHPVLFDTLAEMTAALRQGQGIDVLVTSNLRTLRDEWELAAFDVSPFYVMVRKDDARLLEEVDHALDAIALTDPEMWGRLHRKHYATYNGGDVFFPLAEQRFIQDMAHKEFTAIINPDRIPFSYSENGVPRGIIYDLVQEVIRRSHLNIRIVMPENRLEYRRLINAPDVDIRLDARADHAAAEAFGYKQTSPYLDVFISRLHRKDKHQPFDFAAFLVDSDISALRPHLHSGATILCPSIADLLDKVSSGEVDVGYLYSRTAERAVHDDATNLLMEEKEYAVSTSFAIGVKSDRNALLISILDRAVTSLSQEEIGRIVKKYTGHAPKSLSFKSYLYGNPLIMVAAVTVLFLLLFLTVLFLSSRRKQAQTHAHMLEQQRKNELLEAAVLAAKRAEAAKSQFFSRMSHEIRTPLNAILGFMILAQDKDCDLSQNRSYLNNAETAARQLLDIVNDVLDMAAIESGRLKIAHASFDLKQLVASISDVYRPLSEAKNLTFATKLLTPIDARLVGDPLRLGQILHNLLSNAVKYTEEGHIWLHLSQTVVQNDMVFIRFQVADTGCGMSENLRQRLFTPFEQENADTTRKYGGSGLGLHIVKSLVTLLDGVITVRSDLGAGTTMTVELPFVRQDQQAGAPSLDDSPRLLAAEDEAGAPPLANWGGRRVLLAEDHPMNRLVLSGLLKKLGVSCDMAEDGQQAVAMFTASKPGTYDAILMDVQMPVMDGLEATKAIRAAAHPEAKSISIIAVTANAFREDVAAALACGMNAHVSKPIDIKLLAATLQRCPPADGGDAAC